MRPQQVGHVGFCAHSKSVAIRFKLSTAGQSRVTSWSCVGIDDTMPGKWLAGSVRWVPAAGVQHWEAVQHEAQCLSRQAAP